MHVNGNPIQTHVKLTLLKWLLQKKSAYSFDITESCFKQCHLWTTICSSILFLENGSILMIWGCFSIVSNVIRSNYCSNVSLLILVEDNPLIINPIDDTLSSLSNFFYWQNSKWPPQKSNIVDISANSLHKHFRQTLHFDGQRIKWNHYLNYKPYFSHNQD